VKLPPPSSSEGRGEEKFFRICLGGPMASCLPRGRPLGPDRRVRVESGQPKTAPIFIEVGWAVTAYPFSRLDGWQTGGLGSLRWRRGHRFLPESEREKDGIRR
jgi:hypothetical protein